MLRSIIYLAACHWREHWLREVLCLLAIAAVAVLIYAGNLSGPGAASAARVATQLGNIRYNIVLWWIAVTAAYTLLTAFHGYGDTRRCYATLLLRAGSDMGRRCACGQVDGVGTAPVGGYIGCRHPAVGCPYGNGRAVELYTLQHIPCRLVQFCGHARAFGLTPCGGGGDGGGRVGGGAYVPVVYGAYGTLPVRVGGDGTRLCRDVVDAGVVVFAHGRLCDKLCVVCGAAGGGICAVVP